MMNWVVHLLAAVVIVVCSCSAHKPGPSGSPLPLELRRTSGWQFEFEGKDYRQAQNGRNLVNHSVELNGEDGLAYVVYSFGGFAPITDLDSIIIDLAELQQPQGDAAYYVGLGDFALGGWKWFDAGPPGFVLELGAGSNFVSPDGVLHLAVVLDGDAIGEVETIELVGNNQPEWVEESVQAIAGIFEPSGICLGPDNTSLFIVDDGTFAEPSGVAEVDFEFNLIQRRDLGTDLEGVCYCPLDGWLYVVDEAAEVVYTVDPASLMMTGSFYYSRSFGGDEVISQDGDGVEDIAFIADPAVAGGGYFLLLNQNDPTALLRIDRGDIDFNPPEDPAPLSGFTLVEQRNAGALYFDEPKRQLWVVHSWMDFVEVFNIDTMKLISRDNFPGFAQEGATLGPGGELWVCDDTGFLGKYVWAVQ